MPILFVGHGNPMNAIVDSPYSRSWEALGKTLPTPKTIVCMSAQWLTKGSFVTSTLHPTIIYDFYGFPQELYEVSYPVKGNKTLAETITHISHSIQLDTEWGIDHGAWSVLKRMYPQANIPILQISVDYYSPPEVQYELFKSLKPLRDEGVLFIGSGNSVHNLSALTMNNEPHEWAVEFEETCKELIKIKDISSLINYKKLPNSSLAIPTDDHYRPLINTLGLLEKNENTRFFNEGIDMGSISMLSFISEE